MTTFKYVSMSKYLWIVRRDPLSTLSTLENY